MSCHTCKGYGSRCCLAHAKDGRCSGRRLMCAMSAGDVKALRLYLDFGNVPLAQAAFEKVEVRND